MDRPLRVVIVGAGVSGIACARALTREAGKKHDGHARPVSVVLLEGRSRLGGRTWSYELEEGLVVDLGGSWIHGWRGNPLTSLADAAGLDLSPPGFDHDGAELGFDDDGIVFPESVVDSAWRAYNDVFARTKRASKALPHQIKHDRQQDIPIADVTEPAMRAAVGKLRRRLDMQARRAAEKGQVDGTSGQDEERLKRLFDVFVAGREGYFNASMRSLSFHWMCDEKEEVELGGDRLVRNGYRKLVAYLAHGLEILLEHTVTHVIDHGAGNPAPRQHRYSVRTQNGAVFEADCVVITVPLGVLKAGSIEFSPPLAPWKCDAIQRMGFGVLDKVVLQFTQPFWGSKISWLFHTSSQHAEFPYFLSMYPEIGQPVLVAFISSDFARQIEALSDNEAIQRALAVLACCSQWPSDTPSRCFVRGVVTRWSRDPFSWGSYSFIAVGSSGEDYDALARPLGEGSLRFAGEGTNRRRPGTVAGAYLSGVREARHILRELCSSPK